ncbi:MAG: holo-ACP synthase [Dissulfurispiraceae bacterium]
MIIGIGIDIVEIDRIMYGVQRWRHKFLEKIFSDSEISYCYKRKNVFQCLAGRFAAKEALIKALSDSEAWDKVPSLKDIVILNHPSGKPYITVRGDLPEKFVISLTLSHERHYAVALVILESTNK